MGKVKAFFKRHLSKVSMALMVASTAVICAGATEDVVADQAVTLLTDAGKSIATQIGLVIAAVFAAIIGVWALKRAIIAGMRFLSTLTSKV